MNFTFLFFGSLFKREARTGCQHLTDWRKNSNTNILAFFLHVTYNIMFNTHAKSLDYRFIYIEIMISADTWTIHVFGYLRVFSLIKGRALGEKGNCSAIFGFRIYTYIYVFRGLYICIQTGLLFLFVCIHNCPAANNIYLFTF